MNNLFSKSDATYEKLVQQLKTVLDNQRGLRMDINRINLMTKKLINAMELQKQVDEYFEDSPDKEPEEVEHL